MRSGLAAATEVTRGREGRYEVTIHPDWSVGGRPNGGYLMALLARAGLDALPDPHAVTISAHFLSSPLPGVAQVRVKPLRAGKTTSTARVQLRQGDTLRIEGHLTAGTLRSTAQLAASTGSGELSLDLLGAPEPLDRPENCLAAPEQVGALTLPLMQRLQVRLDPSCVGFASGNPTRRMRMGAWVQLPPDDPTDPLDPLLPLLASDCLPPTIWDLQPGGWAPTVELTCHLRALPSQVPLSVWTHAGLVQDGWFDEEALVRDGSGHVVAQARQLARAPRSDADTKHRG